MGEMVEIRGDDAATTQGYLAGEAGPGLVVIQEWWGLVDHIKDVCDRFAAEGFVALAPDLYHGKTSTEPDECGKLLMGMNIERAATELSGSVSYLLGSDRVEPKKVGTVGFCMGGNLALLLSTLEPIEAAVGFYPYPRTEVDLSTTKASAIQLHIAEHDEAPSPEMAAKLVEQARMAGAHTEMHVYEGTDHAFFNDTRPGIFDPDAAALAWERTLGFFRARLR